MKVSTRIASGFGVLILLAVAVLTYQVIIIQQLNQINTDIADMNVGQVSQALTGLELQSDQALVEEFGSKFIVRQDRDYLRKFRSYVKDMENHLAKLGDSATSEKERTIVERLTRSLHDLQARSEKAPQSHDPPKWFDDAGKVMREDER